MLSCLFEMPSGFVLFDSVEAMATGRQSRERGNLELVNLGMT